MFLLRRIAMGGSHTGALEHSCFKGFVCKVLPKKGILNLCLVITDAVSRRLFTETLSKQAAKVKLLVLRVSHCIEQQQQL